jgi:ABC-2 type transport system permease protein
MQVFKAYFKIIKRHATSLLIYFVIFAVITMLITNSLGGQPMGTFTETKTSIAFFNDDNDSALIGGLRDYLSKTSDIVNISNDTESIQDALFFGQIQYVLRVPEGFTESFLGGSDGVKLQKTAGLVSASTVNMDFLIEKYLGTASLYVKNVPGISQDDIVRNVGKDLEVSAAVDMSDYSKQADLDSLSYYFQFIAYTILTILIMGVTSIMMAFNETDLSNRSLCSPMSSARMNAQLVLGNGTFALGVWAGLCVIIFVMYGSFSLSAGVMLLCLNALVFTLASLSIAFLIGKFIRNHGAQAAIANVVSLGIGFLSGVFVEQAMLGKTVLTIASFTPGYWYVKAVNDIRDITVFNAQNLQPVIYGMLIQLGFATAILIVALAISKQRRRAAIA